MYPYPVTPPGQEPIHVLAADLDNDNHLDFVVTDYWFGEVHVYLGNGDGTFMPPILHPVGAYVSFAALGDFDEDGRLDLAVADYHDNLGVAILMGNGDGTFGPVTRVANSDGAYYVTVGDFNNDQQLDLVATGSSRHVFLGNGDGTFSPGLAILADAEYAVAGDFNGDGFDDLAASQAAEDEVKVFLNNGAGNFSSVETFATGGNPGHLVAEDLNNDQLVDLAVARTRIGNPPGPNDISVLLGRGDGTFEAADLHTTGHEPVFIAVADLNMDGLSDLVTSNFSASSWPDPQQPSLSVILGTGEGEFANAIPVDVVRYAAFSIAVGDFDGDGIEDLAKPCFGSGDVGILFGKGDGTFVVPGTAWVGDAPQSIAVADIDGDERLDLVTANEDSNDVSVMLANVSGSFHTEVRFPA
jgi:hypothetical protein